MRYIITVIIVTIAAAATAASITFNTGETLTATKLNAALTEKKDAAAFDAYSAKGRFNAARYQNLSTAHNSTRAGYKNLSTATQTKLNSKVNSGGAAVFSSLSTTSATRYIDVAGSGHASVPRTGVKVFGTMTSMWFIDGATPTAKRMGSGGGTTDISGKLDVQRFLNYSAKGRSSGSTVTGISQFSNYTGADGATWIDKGTEPPSLVTRIADKLYSVVVSLKATLYAILGWSSNSHDFGNTVTVGSFANYSTTLYNTGSYATQSLTFSNLSSGVFRAYSTPTSIAANSSAKVKYRFTPADTTAHTGHLWASATGIETQTLTLTGTGVNTGYTTYFSNDFGCADSGTVYTCASTDAFTSETDTGSLGAISSGQYVLTYGGVSTGSYITKSSLASHGDITLRFRLRLSTASLWGASTGEMKVFSVYNSGNPIIDILLRANTSGGALGQVKLSWTNRSYATTSDSKSLSFVADTDYDFVINLKPSAAANDSTGTVTLSVNGTELQNLTGMNTFYPVNLINIGMTYTSKTLTGSILYDNVLVGYK